MTIARATLVAVSLLNLASAGALETAVNAASLGTGFVAESFELDDRKDHIIIKATKPSYSLWTNVSAFAFKCISVKGKTAAQTNTALQTAIDTQEAAGKTLRDMKLINLNFAGISDEVMLMLFTDGSTQNEGVKVVDAVLMSNLASLTGVTVASRDGKTLVQGNIVLLTKQTTASQNGPYVVGAVVTGAADLTRPPWWPTGLVVPDGFRFRVAADATSYTAMPEWKVTGHGKVVGTDDPLIYPTIIKGHGALDNASPSLLTVSNLFVTTGAEVTATNQTTAANGVKAVQSAGQGTGSLVVTGPNTTTDTVSYTITN